METPTAGPRRQVLLVLGMHRGGTSATAGLLAQLGARSPATPMRADRNNPHGYWESDRLFRLHDRLLAGAGSAWDDWGPLDAARLAGAGEAGGSARAALADAFTAEFGEVPAAGDLVVVKDPRICRFLPLWLATLADLGAEAKAVLPLRHPLEVAASLARRDGTEPEAALLLWLRHLLEAEAASRALPRAFLCYADLVADWRAVADRLAATLAIRWPVDPEAAAPEVAAFLSGDLRHHAADPDAALPAWAAEGWAALSALADGGEAAAGAAAMARLDALRAALDAGDALIGTLARRAAGRAAAEAAVRTAAETAAAGASAAAAAEAAELGAALAAEQARAAAAEAAGAALAARAEGLAAALAAARAGAEAAADAERVLHARIAAAEAAARAEREAFLASTSWRITAPLRRAARGFDRLRRPRPGREG